PIGIFLIFNMIDDATVSKIFDAANILDVVSDFVALKKRGNNYFGCCPFHNEKTGSFSVSPAKNIYYCFGCHKGGNSVNFIMEHENLPYYEALKYLANKFHIEVTETERTPEEQERHDDRESMMVLNEFAKNYFIRNMTETEEGRAIGYKYFKERGFNEETIKTYELGYSLSDRKAFTEFALKSGYQLKYLISTSNGQTNSGTGLTIKHDDGYTFDRFSGRVMFPIHNITGKVIGFGGRVLDARTKGVNVKYMNSPQSEIYDKSRSLYGIYQAKASIVKNDKCFLVEGYTDVLSMHQSGIENVVASNGTALTIEQIRLIKKFTSNVTVLYDGDDAGIHAALRGIDMILAEGLNVKVLLLPDGEDPDSFARNHSSSELEEFIGVNETDFVLFKTRLLLNDAGNDPIKKAELINDIVASIAVVPDDIKRLLYVKECAKLMDIDEAVLKDATEKKLNKITYQQLEAAQKERERERRQKELAAQAQTQAQPQQTQIQRPILNEETALNKRVCELESELLKYLIRFGNNVLFEVKKESGPTEIVTVSQYILNELKINEIVFKNEDCKKMLDIYISAAEQSQTPDDSLFTQCHDTNVSSFAVNLLVAKNEVSKEFWDKRNRYVPPEQGHLKDMVDSTLNHYKFEIAQQEIKNIGKIIAQLQTEPDNDEKIAEQLSKLSVFQRYIIKLGDSLGIVMPRK
ncbi:MAG: DNA primase, partial [Salinivirgaceae bacterium]|nr:DNA primase [Salinivirgaceae bacterium]